MTTSEVEKGSLTHKREAEEAERGIHDATDVASSATQPENAQTKIKKKAMKKVKIISKKGKYTSMMRARTSATE